MGLGKGLKEMGLQVSCGMVCVHACMCVRACACACVRLLFQTGSLAQLRLVPVQPSPKERMWQQIGFISVIVIWGWGICGANPDADFNLFVKVGC